MGLILGIFRCTPLTCRGTLYAACISNRRTFLFSARWLPGALDAIHSHPATDQAHVAELIGYDRATIGGVMDRLEKKGWIRRVISTKDRRARELSLTNQGLLVRQELLPIVQALQKDILHPLSEAERTAFIQMAQAVALSQQEPSNT
jgi:DNA-binding MarR family transcriptional regulator